MRKCNAGYQLPNIACESEAWALLRMPMHEAIRLSARFDSFRISISAVDAQGEPVPQGALYAVAYLVGLRVAGL